MNSGRDPLQLFQEWYDTAAGSRLRRNLVKAIYPPAMMHQPDAMTLATVDANHQPHARIVLFKGFHNGGFTFYTNYESAKADDLRTHPQAALLFHWQMPERQVRIEGKVSMLPPEKSDQYWRSRLRGSQIGGWASNQSRPIESAEALQKAVQEQTERFRGQDVPRPPHWGGYSLQPQRIEFWEAKVFRLHDRIVYDRTESGWEVKRLAP